MTSHDASKSPGESSTRLSGAPLASHPSFLLARANARSLSLGNAALVGLGLKVRSYSVLALASGNERPSQRDLATFLSLDPSQVVALVDDLEVRGLVERVADPNDRRANVVRATAAGAELAATAQAALREADLDVFAGLTDAERAALTDLLGRVAFRA